MPSRIRQIAQSHLDTGRRSGTILLQGSRCLRHFKGSAFQSLVPNDQAIAREPKHLHAIATPIEERNSARFTCWPSSRSTSPVRPSKLFLISVWPVLANTRKDVGKLDIAAILVSMSRESSDHRTDCRSFTALGPQHDATGPPDFQGSSRRPLGRRRPVRGRGPVLVFFPISAGAPEKPPLPRMK